MTRVEDAEKMAGFTRYEKIWASQAGQGSGAPLRFAVAARTARLATPVSSTRERALCGVAAGVAGPALVAFVLWLLQRAEEMRLQRLYFVARDGQVMLKIARILAGPLGARCEMSYLYGSRSSWCPPSFLSLDNQLMDGLVRLDDVYSVRSTFARLHVAPERFQEELMRLGLSPEKWNHELDASQSGRLRSLLHGEELQQTLREEAALRYPSVLEYLKQEGLFDAVPWALVDIGWHGTLQDALGRMLTREGGRPPRGFYCGTGGASDNAVGGQREAYFVDVRDGRAPEQLLDDMVTPLETFCGADHGHVLGYAREGEGMVPVLDAQANHPIVSWGLPLVQETICRFATELAREGLCYPRQDLRPLALEGIRLFWNRPTTGEAHAWGDLPCEDESHWYRLAPGYSARDVARALAAGRFEHPQFHSWHAGSVARTRMPVRLPIALVTRVKRAVRRLRVPGLPA
jgi:hypothetical protein